MTPLSALTTDVPHRQEPYQLRPPSGERDLIEACEMPLQLLHISPSTIPAEVADKLCKGTTPSDLLAELNDIFGTQPLH